MHSGSTTPTWPWPLPTDPSCSTTSSRRSTPTPVRPSWTSKSGAFVDGLQHPRATAGRRPRAAQRLQHLHADVDVRTAAVRSGRAPEHEGLSRHRPDTRRDPGRLTRAVTRSVRRRRGRASSSRAPSRPTARNADVLEEVAADALHRRRFAGDPELRPSAIGGRSIAVEQRVAGLRAVRPARATSTVCSRIGRERDARRGAATSTITTRRRRSAGRPSSSWLSAGIAVSSPASRNARRVGVDVVAATRARDRAGEPGLTRPPSRRARPAVHDDVEVELAVVGIRRRGVNVRIAAVGRRRAGTRCRSRSVSRARRAPHSGSSRRTLVAGFVTVNPSSSAPASVTRTRRGLSRSTRRTATRGTGAAPVAAWPGRRVARRIGHRVSVPRRHLFLAAAMTSVQEVGRTGRIFATRWRTHHAQT